MTATIVTLALVNETEAARILGLSVKTLRRWRWVGRGPAYRKIGSAVRYHPDEDLAAFVEAARRTSTSDTGEAA
jgi:predicted site-specific integrase-resolvase